MKKRNSHLNKKTGLSPGSLVHTGEFQQTNPTFKLFRYTQNECREYNFDELNKLLESLKTRTPEEHIWLDITGVHNKEIITSISHIFDVHTLAQEDIMNVNQRAKIDIYHQNLFLVVKMLYFANPTDADYTSEQLSIIFGENYLITFQEQNKESDCLNNVRARLKTPKSSIAQMGSDYLLYSILDTVVDHYFVVLEKLGDQVENIEQDIFTDTKQDTLKKIHSLKQDMIIMRKSIWPLREIISSLERLQQQLIHQETIIYLRDVHDHTLRCIEMVESFRELLNSLVEIYISNTNNKMNAVMKVLTMFTAIFAPLTFIVGIYGMNFENMPELKSDWGYPMVWVLNISIVFVIFLFFKRKKWL